MSDLITVTVYAQQPTKPGYDGLAKIRMPSGSIPRIGEQLEYMSYYYKVERVIWEVAGAGGTGDLTVSLYVNVDW